MERNKIKIGDSFDILPQIPDNYANVIITDPPYDLKEHQKQFLHDQFRRISKGWVIVFSPPENQWIFPDIEQFLFWIKPISTKNTSKRYSRFVEMMFVYGEGVWNAGRHWSQYTNVFTDLVDEKNIHPFRKPPSIAERLIKNHTDFFDVVLDPFCGSGVFCEAAHSLGRNFIGIEINRELISNSFSSNQIELEY